MSYKECLELAGAKVIAFEEFGSYQGDWLAKVEYLDKVGWVKGSYGSCSGCDAYEAEFGFNTCSDHYWEHSNICEKCCELKQAKADFGKEYLDNILTQEEIEKNVKEYSSWDCEASLLIKFVEDNK